MNSRKTSYFIVAFLLAMSTVWAGLVTISLSQVDLKSNVPELDGKRGWLANVQLEGDSTKGESLYGTVKAGDVQDGTDKSLYDFTIKAKITNTQCSYPIDIVDTGREEDQYVQQVRQTYSEGNWNWNRQAELDKCGVSGTDRVFGVADNGIYRTGSKVLADFDRLGNWHVFQCFEVLNLSRAGNVGEFNREFEGEVKVETTNPLYSAIDTTVKINPITQPSAVLPNKLGTVEFVGYTMGVRDCPSITVDKYKPLYSASWKLADTNLYKTYKDTRSSLYTNLYGSDGVWDEGRVDNVIRTLNANAQAVLDSNLQFTFRHTRYNGDTQQVTDAATIKNSASLSDGQILLPINEILHRPNLRMLILADYIGVNIQVGKPKIVSVTPEKFPTGLTGTVRISVKNIGDGDGTFIGSVSCSSGISQSGEGGRTTLGAGETGTITVYGTGTTESKEQSVSCTAKVTDSKLASNSDSQLFSWIVQGQVFCDSGQVACSGKKIVGCNDAGTGYTKVIEDCGAKGETYTCQEGKCVNTAVGCAQEGQSPTQTLPCCSGLKAKSSGFLGTTTICAAPEDGGLGELLFPIIIIIVAIVAIVGAIAFRMRRK